MINLSNEIKGFIFISLIILGAYQLHQYLCDIYKIITPLASIYIFNYLAIILFLIISKLNFIYSLVNVLLFFIVLTFIKMLSTVIFFLYLNSDGSYDIQIVIYNFFPVYFLLLSFEIIYLNKSLNNI